MDYNYIDFLICNKIIFHRLTDTGHAHGTRTRHTDTAHATLHCKQQFACAKHPAGAALPHMGRPALVVGVVEDSERVEAYQHLPHSTAGATEHAVNQAW